jgi:opacity protein-like surface antigen
MRSVKSLIAAGAATLLSSMAFAADMPSIMSAPMYAPAPVEDFGGWYLRGDIGFSNQGVKKLDWFSYPTLLSLNQNTGFDTAGIFGLGVGYQFNNWFRADVTGQYRGKSNFHGTDVFVFSNAGVPTAGADTYTASKSEWLALANAYVDLGTWWCVTPFIGRPAVSLSHLQPQSGTSHGLCIPVWLIGSIRALRSNWAIAT